MALGTAIQKATNTPQIITWKKSNGGVWDLSDGTITARMSKFEDRNARDCDGTFNFVTDGTDGQFEWNYGTVDVSQAGNFYVQFKCTYTTEKFDLTKVTEFVILPSL